MTTAPSSPKRRHILSSINPEWLPITEERSKFSEPVAFPSPTHEPPAPDADRHEDEEREPAPEAPQLRRKTSKFRFKSKRSSSHRSSRDRDRDRDRDRGRIRDQDLEDGEGDDRKDDAPYIPRRHRRHHEHHHTEDDRDRHLADDDNNDNDSGHHEHHRHKRRRRHHRSHHHHHSRTRTRSPTPPNPYDPPPLSPEAAFRASLFDAMADDEGAAYWEAVYGQPMHVYSRGGGGGDNHNNDNGGAGAGELEQMDEEEYAAYVRQRMWEKTHEGLLEERARREARKRAREEEETEARRLTREMEESLRRGEERRRRKGWRERWEAYVRAWAEWDNNHGSSSNNNKSGGNEESDKKDDDEGSSGESEQREKKRLRRHPLEHDADMAWPVESGRRADLRDSEGKTDGAVREFFARGLLEAQEEAGEVGFAARLKDERVRWHPDKIQQRLGGRVDEALMRDVTAVFQAVDKLWSDARAKKEA